LKGIDSLYNAVDEGEAAINVEDYFYLVRDGVHESKENGKTCIENVRHVSQN